MLSAWHFDKISSSWSLLTFDHFYFIFARFKLLYNLKYIKICNGIVIILDTYLFYIVWLQIALCIL